MHPDEDNHERFQLVVTKRAMKAAGWLLDSYKSGRRTKDVGTGENNNRQEGLKQAESLGWNKRGTGNWENKTGGRGEGLESGKVRERRRRKDG